MEATITDCSEATEEEQEEAVSCKEWLLLKSPVKAVGQSLLSLHLI